MNIGSFSIERERKRQIEVEGWTLEHDDKHTAGELGMAAICYHWAADLERNIISSELPEDVIPPPKDWPWDKEWWKPASNPRRNYEKAGALYMAERERLRRLPGIFTPQEMTCSEGIQICAAGINVILSPFTRIFNRQQESAFNNSVAHGFHDTDMGNGTRIALIHSEASECLDAIRHGNKPDDHIPEFTGAEAELADVVIRCMDMAEKNRWNLAEAIECKMAYNAGRPHMHGGKAF